MNKRFPRLVSPRIEWPTVILIFVCTLAIPLITVFAAGAFLWPGILLLGGMLALHSSLQHEALHGHPFHSARLNELLVSIPFGLFVPYRRFRDTHLAHHRDERLTDPHDDPECNYADPEHWNCLPQVIKRLLIVNNTLAGRVLLGPLIGFYCFYKKDLMLALQGEQSIVKAYCLHALGLIPLCAWLFFVSSMPLWAYVLSAYLALSILRVRTYLEHRAHDDVQGRTAIVEDRGILAVLFLNNNFHLVHHMYPRAPWYRLPSLYRGRREEFLRRNQDYVYRNYREIFCRYLFNTKDPVPHPLRIVSNGMAPEKLQAQMLARVPVSNPGKPTIKRKL